MIRILLVNFIFGLYFSIRVYKAFFSKLKFYIAVPIIFLLAQSFFILKLVGYITGAYIPDGIMNISYILLGISVYMFLYFLLFDILRVLFRKSFKRGTGSIVLILTVLTFAYGYYHQLDTKTKYYDIAINKPLKEPLRLAVFSDVHVGSGMTVERLNKYADRINALKPDIILVVGDIIDSDLRAFKEDFRSSFRRLNAPLGVYAVLGNHEYFSGDITAVQAAIEDAGMKVLKDEAIFFEDKGFYLAGRDSIRHSMSSGDERSPVYEFMKKFDSSMPLIIMDHVPKNITDGKVMNADLQISGHTHGGQFFPVTEIVKFLYPESAGLLRDGDFNLLVTSGLGLWGPPMRVGSDSEILLVTVTEK